MTRKSKVSMMVAVCGGVAAIAHADPYLINGSGATLQANFFQNPAATLDYIDADGDGWAVALGTTGLDAGVDDQLVFSSPTTAPFPSKVPGTLNIANLSNHWWHFHYRESGSGNGLRELLLHGSAATPAYATDDAALVPDSFGHSGNGNFDADGNGDYSNDTLNAIYTDNARWNRNLLVSGGVLQVPPGVAQNVSGVPYLSKTDGSYEIETTVGAGGLQMDFGAADVPFAWFVVTPADSGASNPRFHRAGPIRVPGAPGYGDNDLEAVNKDGTPAGQSNKLLEIPAGLNNNTTSPDANTVFDTPLVNVPVAAIVNYGVGLQQIDMSDLRHANATGRRMNGENLMVITRDSGSGTRNAFMNGIGLDPSFGRGENIGPRSTSSSNDVLGADWAPSNRGGSSRMEGSARNHRLAIGHTGAERGLGSWLTNNQLELLAIRSDIKGGTVYARPNLENVLNGGVDGYNIAGPASISVIGDPRSAAPAQGGYGWEPSISGENPADRATALPGGGAFPPANPNVAAFVNNVTRSLEAFVSATSGAEFTPGELLATSFVPVQASDFIPASAPNPNSDYVDLIDQNENAALADFLMNDSGVSPALRDSAYDAFNTANGGRIPTRSSGAAYSDSAAPGGSATGAFYVTQGGTAVSYGDPISSSSGTAITRDLMRNKIAGDFNGDELRTAADAAGMLAAYAQRQGGAAWIAPAGTGPTNGGTPGSAAIIEVLGDFTGDGNFDAADIRYWADGLVITNGAVNRHDGFKAVDNAAGANFFGTVLATGASYEAGDSAADVSGSGAYTVGFAPIGFDGVVDLQDVDYVCANQGDWSDLEQAIYMDLSCDMNGDLVVDGSDIDFIIGDVLETVRGDFNLDGVKDSTDRAVILANLGTGTSYSEGDFDCDGDVDAADLAAFDGQCGAADLAPSFGTLDIDDVLFFLNAFATSDPAADLASPVGTFNIDDVLFFLNAFAAGCP